MTTLTRGSFAFVEYESRRDADDAYHEMHNKRIGRDDMLKIEVGGRFAELLFDITVGPFMGADPPYIVGSYSSFRLLAF